MAKFQKNGEKNCNSPEGRERKRKRKIEIEKEKEKLEKIRREAIMLASEKKKRKKLP